MKPLSLSKSPSGTCTKGPRGNTSSPNRPRRDCPAPDSLPCREKTVVFHVKHPPAYLLLLTNAEVGENPLENILSYFFSQHLTKAEKCFAEFGNDAFFQLPIQHHLVS